MACGTRLPDGQRVMDQEWVRVNLARVHAGLAVLRLLTWKVSMQSQLDIADCSSAKVFGTELYQEAFGLLFEIVGPQAYVARGRTTPGLDARLEFLVPAIPDAHIRRRNQRAPARSDCRVRLADAGRGEVTNDGLRTDRV